MSLFNAVNDEGNGHSGKTLAVGGSRRTASIASHQELPEAGEALRGC